MKTISQYKGLPARYYTDQVFFNYEQERLWGNTWQWVGRENEIPQAGNYLTVNLGGEAVFIVRGHDGRLRAMHNVCTHRGAKLLHGQGNCKQAIVCPYHAWSFGLDGQLEKIPDEALFTELDKKALALVPAQVDTWGGFIFVNPNNHSEALVDYLAEMPVFFEQYQFNWKGLREIKRWHYNLAANWKLVVKHYLEDYAFKAEYRKDFAKVGDNLQRLSSGRHLRIKAPDHEKAYLTRVTTTNDFSQKGFIFPNILLNLQENFISLFHIIPQDAEHTRLEIILYQTSEQVLSASSATVVFKEKLEHLMEKNFPILSNIQKNINSRAHPYRNKPCLPEYELGIAHFQRIVAEFV